MCSMKASPLLLRFRMMTAEQVASGRLDVGRLVVASSEEEAASLAKPGETPVRILSADEAARRRLDHRMNERAKRDEENAMKRHEEAFDRFVKALTGENN
jgi:hypothetical protein